MNKFIALAFFALFAAVAHGQIITSLPLGLYNGDSSSSSSAAASAAASSGSSSQLSRVAPSPWVSPLAPIASPLPLNYPYGPYAPLAPLVAPGWGPYGPAGPIAPIPGVVQLV